MCAYYFWGFPLYHMTLFGIPTLPLGTTGIPTLAPVEQKNVDFQHFNRH